MSIRLVISRRTGIRLRVNWVRVRKLVHVRAQAYRSHQRMAGKLAGKFARKYRRPFPELLDVANSRLAEELIDKWDKHDSSKAARSSWLYTNMYWGLRNYCDDVYSKREATLNDVHVAKRTSWIERVMSEIGEEGRALLHVIIEVPREFVHLCMRKPENAKDSLHSHLKRVGWGDEQIERALAQVEECL